MEMGMKLKLLSWLPVPFAPFWGLERAFPAAPKHCRPGGLSIGRDWAKFNGQLLSPFASNCPLEWPLRASKQKRAREQL